VPSYTILQNNFISGELNPMMEGRLDSEKYQTGLSVCENFIPTRLGSLVKRPGTRYVATLAGITNARLVLFDAGVNGKFMAEFSPLKIRFWTQAGALVMHAGSPFGIVTTYASAELSELSCVMNKGVMYIVHHNHKPAMISLDSTYPFKLTEPAFTGGRTFSAAGDYPSCQAFKGGRWYLAATDNEPNSIFASRTPDSTTGDRFTDFTFSEIIEGAVTVLSTHAIYLQETDMYGSRINWLVNQKRILAGAGRSIWMDGGVIAAPATFDMSVTLNGGCNSTYPKALDNYVIYAGIGGRSLNVMQYRTDDDGYVNAEVSLTARHMIRSGIKAFTLLNGENGSVIWVLCNDGSLCTCSIDLGSGVIGWARHPMGTGSDGEDMTVQSLEVMPGDDTSDDVLWLTVLRSGATQIEKLDMKAPDSMDEAVYVDCSRTIEYETPTDTVTVPHLANESVDALADNAVLPVKTLDASGIGTYDRPFSRITIGYPIAAKVRLLRPELPANGTSQGKKRQLQEQTLRLYRSLGGKVVANGKTSSILPLVPGTYRLGDYFPAFTGDKKLEINAAADYDGSVDIASDEPVPFNLLAVMTRYALLEV
jgi:hypothetical protein